MDQKWMIYIIYSNIIQIIKKNKWRLNQAARMGFDVIGPDRT